MRKSTTFIFWALFVAAHLVNFLNIPLFEDEGEYLLLSEAIIKDPAKNFFIYSHNGLFPLYGWLIAIFNLLVNDALVSGRLVNILLSSTLVFWISCVARLHKLPQGFVWVAQPLLLTSPIILLNSHIGLLDTSVLVFIAWYIYFTDYYIQTHNKKVELGIGLAFLAALLTKATGIFGLPSCALIIFKAIRIPEKRRIIVNSLTIFALSFLTSYIYFSFFGKQIKSDSGASITAFSSLSEFLEAFKLRTLVTWLWFKAYFLPYLLILIMLLLKRGRNSYKTLYITMIALIFTSLFIMISLNRFYFPRHILTVVLPLIVIFSGLVSKLDWRLKVVFVSMTLIFQTTLSYKILADPRTAELALEDRFEYFENYTSGLNLGEISSFLLNVAGQEKILVWLDGSYVMEYGLRRQLPPNIKIKSFRLDDNLSGVEPQEVYSTGEKTYIVVNRWKPKNLNQLTLVREFPVSFRHSQYIYQLAR